MKPPKQWFSDPPSPPYEDPFDPDDNLSLLLDQTDGDIARVTRNLAGPRIKSHSRRSGKLITSRSPRSQQRRRWRKKSRVKEPMMPIFDPLHNAREMAKQLVLLEDHIIHPPKHCPDCIRKHLLTSEALAEEAVSLAQTAPMRSYFQDVAEELRTISRGYVAKRSRGELQQSARKIRKRLSKMGFDSIGNEGETKELQPGDRGYFDAEREKKAAEEAGITEDQQKEFEEAEAAEASSDAPEDVGDLSEVNVPDGMLEVVGTIPPNSKVYFCTMDPQGLYDRIQASFPAGKESRGKWVKGLEAGVWYPTGVLAMGSTITGGGGTYPVTMIPQVGMTKGGGIYYPNTALLCSKRVMPYGDGRVYTGTIENVDATKVQPIPIYKGVSVLLNGFLENDAPLVPANKVEPDQLQFAVIAKEFYENDPLIWFYLRDKTVTKYKNDLTVSEAGKFTDQQLFYMGLIESQMYNDADNASALGLCKRVGVTNEQFLANQGCARNVSRNLAIAAIVNAYYESGLNPMAKSGGGEDSVGLFQINRAYLGKDYSVEQLQSAWINTRVIMESVVRQVDKFKHLIEQEARGEPTDPAEWTAIFTEYIERPANPQASAKARAKTARELFRVAKPVSAPTGSLLAHGKDPTGDDMGALLHDIAGRTSPALYREIEELDKKVRKLPQDPSTWTLTQANVATAMSESLRRVVAEDPNFPEAEGVFALSRAATISKESGQIQGMVNALKELKQRYPSSQQAAEAEQLIRRYEPTLNPNIPRNVSVVKPPRDTEMVTKVAVGAAAVLFAGVLYKGLKDR